jgi:hypothetical protein
MSRAPRNWSPPEPHRQANRRYLQPCTTIAALDSTREPVGHFHSPQAVRRYWM